MYDPVKIANRVCMQGFSGTIARSGQYTSFKGVTETVTSITGVSKSSILSQRAIQSRKKAFLYNTEVQRVLESRHKTNELKLEFVRFL